MPLLSMVGKQSQNFPLKSVRILTLSIFTGHVPTEGIYSIEQWQLTKGSKEAGRAEEGTSKER